MAEINIEPRDKGKGFNWLWILGILALIGIVAWLFARNGNNQENNVAAAETEEVRAATETRGGVPATATKELGSENAVNDANIEDMWRDVDLNVPEVDYPEITISSPDFEVRGNENYSVYSLGENLLFETDKATLSTDAKQNLDQIAASLKQRYNEGHIRIYGHADARANASYNEQLSQERAQAVKQWLMNNANFDASRISIHPMGESDPVASNQTQTGRQKNRRVEIVAMNP